MLYEVNVVGSQESGYQENSLALGKSTPSSLAIIISSTPIDSALPD